MSCDCQEEATAIDEAPPFCPQGGHLVISPSVDFCFLNICTVTESVEHSSKRCSHLCGADTPKGQGCLRLVVPFLLARLSQEGGRSHS